MEVPDPDSVSSADTFRAFVSALRASLDAALATPLESPWDDQRAGWTNWTLATFINGMASWIAASDRLPLDRDAHAIWDVLFPKHGIWDGGEEELRNYLAAVESWAGSADGRDSPEPWRAAAETMRAGVIYE
jgi:hypothetical protein